MHPVRSRAALFLASIVVACSRLLAPVRSYCGIRVVSTFRPATSNPKIKVERGASNGKIGSELRPGSLDSGLPFKGGHEVYFWRPIGNKLGINTMSDAQVHNLFDMMDVDRNGYISYDELGEFLKRNFLKNMPDIVLQKMMKVADSNHDGELSFDEFISLFPDRVGYYWRRAGVILGISQMTDAQLHDFFNQIDTDKSGMIEREELQRLITLRCPSDEFSEPVINLMMEVADVNGDGQISFDEFVTLFPDRLGAYWRKASTALGLDRMPDSQLKQFFEKAGCNGTMSTKELYRVLQESRFGMVNNTVLSRMMAVADVNGNGAIEFEEFAALFPDRPDE